MKRIFCCVAIIFSSLIAFNVPVLAQEDDQVTQILAAKSRVDINSADAATLALALDGVGMSKAEDIVAHREEFGEFKSVDDLEQVRGIGPATIARNRDKILIVTKE